MKINNGCKAIVVILLLFSTVNFVLAQSGRGKGRLKGEARKLPLFYFCGMRWSNVLEVAICFHLRRSSFS